MRVLRPAFGAVKTAAPGWEVLGTHLGEQWALQLQSFVTITCAHLRKGDFPNRASSFNGHSVLAPNLMTFTITVAKGTQKIIAPVCLWAWIE